MDLARDAPARTFLASPARVVANAQVTPEHCRYFVEARRGDGAIAGFAEADVLATHHCLDAAALGLADGAAAAALGDALELRVGAQAARERVDVVGHAVGDDDLDDDDDARPMLPFRVGASYVRTGVERRARIPERDPSSQVQTLNTQHFAETDGAEPVGMGMCGGPVLEAGGACVGMVEGVVPTSDHPLSDHASYIAALDLLPLVDDARRALAARADVPRDAPPGALRDGLA